MRKVIFIFSTILGLGTAAVSYHKQTEIFNSPKSELAQTSLELDKEEELRDDKNARLVILRRDILGAREELKNEQVSLETVQNQLTSAQSEKQGLDNDLQATQDRSAEVNQTLTDQDRLLEELKLAPGVTREELGNRLVQLETERSTKAATFDEIERNIDRVEANNASLRKNIQNHQEDRAEILKKMALNTWSGRVTNSDPQWGLVVFNGGLETGLEPGQNYLVARGNRFIAKLEIVSMEDNQTLASVDAETLVDGFSVRNGDRVILADSVSVR